MLLIMNVLIAGCGNVGARLATLLGSYGHDVSVVDRDPNHLARLGPDFDGIAVAGIPMDQDVLRNAGIEGCDAFAAVTDDDNLNIMASQIAREIFHVPRVVTRIFDPARENVFSHFGLHTICPTRLTSDALYTALVDQGEERVLSFGTTTTAFTCRPVEKALRGRRVQMLPLRDAEELFGVKHADGSFTLAAQIDADYLLDEQDTIICVRVVD